MNDDDAIDGLRRMIHNYGSVIVAYSGGVDSSVVLRIACEQLGDRALGCIGASPALAEAELKSALELAAEHRMPVRIIQTGEHLDPRYAANSGDRCFHCRRHLFESLGALAADLGFTSLADGVHADDQADHTGGIAAARQYGVRSPLLEAGLGKSDVRAIAGKLGLRVWDKPAMACLASRIPAGTAVTIPLLRQVEQAEQSLAAMGFSDFRVRHHGSLARIEVTEADLSRAVRLGPAILKALRSVGYSHVTIDLEPRRLFTKPRYP